MLLSHLLWRAEIDNVVIEERSVVHRNNLDVNIVTRERGATESPAQASARR